MEPTTGKRRGRPPKSNSDGQTMRAMDYVPHATPPPDVQVMARKSTSNLQPVQPPLPQENKEMDDLIRDLEQESMGEQETEPKPDQAATEEKPAAPEATDKIKKLIEKYQGRPEALAKALSEMDDLRGRTQSQLDLLLKNMKTQPAPPQPSSDLPQRVQVQPWDKEKVNREFMDKPADYLEQLQEHTLSAVDRMIEPLYGVAYHFNLTQEFPGLVTKDSAPVIVALSKSMEGNSVMEKLRKAATMYKEQYGYPKTSEGHTMVDVTNKEALATPEPRHSVQRKRTFTREQIRYLSVNKPEEYRRLLPAIQQAHREGRVREA